MSNWPGRSASATTPRRWTGNEDVTVDGQDAAKVVFVLPGRHHCTQAESDDAGTDPDPALPAEGIKDLPGLGRGRALALPLGVRETCLLEVQ